LLLTTIGRKTGQPRIVPLFYVRAGANYVVCNVNPGFERPNPWVLNLLSHPRAEITVGGDVVQIVSREADADELVRYWPALLDIWPAFEQFSDRGGERSVFILEPDIAR
jgi:deazaflavin-dependent oxidoreductase (nitroreductase family)